MWTISKISKSLKFLVLTYEDNFATLIFEVAKALFCHEVAELACPQKPFLCKGIAKGCDALQSFDGFFTLTGRIAQNHSQVRPPISPICIGTFLEKQKQLSIICLSNIILQAESL